MEYLKLNQLILKSKIKNNLDKINNYQKANGKILALTIDDFTKKFPDLMMCRQFSW